MGLARAAVGLVSTDSGSISSTILPAGAKTFSSALV